MCDRAATRWMCAYVYAVMSAQRGFQIQTGAKSFGIRTPLRAFMSFEICTPLVDDSRLALLQLFMAGDRKKVKVIAATMREAAMQVGAKGIAAKSFALQKVTLKSTPLQQTCFVTAAR